MMFNINVLLPTAFSLMIYELGSIFKVSGKEYVLSKSHTLDIPYGEDVYDVEYPENYCCGIKMY